MSEIKEITFHFKNNIDSLRSLLYEYGEISKKYPEEEVIFKVILSEITTTNLTWPSEKNMCFQTLDFAVEQMDNDLITVELDYE